MTGARSIYFNRKVESVVYDFMEEHHHANVSQAVRAMILGYFNMQKANAEYRKLNFELQQRITILESEVKTSASIKEE